MVKENSDLRRELEDLRKENAESTRAVEQVAQERLELRQSLDRAQLRLAQRLSPREEKAPGEPVGKMLQFYFLPHSSTFYHSLG